MTIEKLERVMWRLRNTKLSKLHWNDLQRATMHEIGTDPRTYKLTKRALQKLRWITCVKSNHFALTNRDLSGD